MGLTNSSVGVKAIDSGIVIGNKNEQDIVVALAGNPNVGKSTVFNGLTGMKQHTGNWPGKTVSNAVGYCKSKQNSYIFVDIPGTYSLMAHSAEEEVARDFLCFGSPDAVVVVCDATCLERNLNLVLQAIELSKKTVVCVNLLDEAKRKGISVDLNALSERLGVSVIGTVARKKNSLNELLSELDTVVKNDYKRAAYKVRYTPEIEQAISMIEPCLTSEFAEKIDCRWLSLRLLEDDKNFLSKISDFLNCDIFSNENISKAVNIAKNFLQNQGITAENLKDLIVTQIVKQAESICDGIYKKSDNYSDFDRKLDRVLTSRLTGYPIMLLLLILIFWITISGANYPSQLLSNLFSKGQELLTDLFSKMAAPDWLHGVLVLGVYRVLTWVVAVMLPPMAIFFPLFTLLEDLGYLPRVAYNLDKPFKRCNACGKQALTMCMGFGCNAAGVVGCRIIDSPRERLLAILTNNFVPCNGRFPTIISIISMFFIGSVAGGFSTFLSAVVLTAVILLGIAATFFVTKFLSTTLLKGVPSSFILEMPSFRRPQISKVIVRSIFDRTVFVLGRAVAVAAPAGVLIWLMANINIGEQSALRYFAELLDPFARLMGLDGIILIAFILGFPANEIVVPIMLMAYLSEESLLQINDISVLKQVLVDNGWTIKTAVSVVLFSLMHWPCSTTLITIKKETGSIKWTLLSVLIPTMIGICACVLFNVIASIFV